MINRKIRNFKFYNAIIKIKIYLKIYHNVQVFKNKIYNIIILELNFHLPLLILYLPEFFFLLNIKLHNIIKNNQKYKKKL